jgi:FMN phosphatase YigB (HAD superfamily)
MVKIKAIAFDCGNVILSNSWTDPVFEKFCKEIAVSYRVGTKIFFKHYDGWLKFGRGCEYDFFKDLLENSKNKKLKIKDIKRFYYKKIHMKKAFSLVKKLYKKYPLYTLNDEAREWMNYRIKKFKLKKYFKAFITSAFVGYAKPDKRIYQAMLKKSKCKPEEVIFIDNNPKLVRAARKLGINGITFRSKEQLIKSLKKFRVEF